MSDNVDYSLGDVANGHVQAEEGWVPLPSEPRRWRRPLTICVAALLSSAVVGLAIAGWDGTADAAASPRQPAEGTSGTTGETIDPDLDGVDQWPDGTRVDFIEGAKQQFSQWHMDEALANWYPNQGAICEMVTLDGPLTLAKDIADGYEATARAFGDDAYAIGWATAVLAVDHCPNAYAFVADAPRTDARAKYDAANQAAAERAQAEADALEEEEVARLEAEETDREALVQAIEEYWPTRAKQITWASTVCRDYRDTGRYSDSGGDASAEVERYWKRFGYDTGDPSGNPWDLARAMLEDRCGYAAKPQSADPPVETAETTKPTADAALP